MAEDDAKEGADILGALARAEPSWMKDGHGIRGPDVVETAPSRKDRGVDFPPGEVKREPRQPFFPEQESSATAGAATEAVPNIAFILSDVSTGDITKVLVTDGKIKGTFPDGMGFGNYELTLADPSDSIIYAMATFDPTTLELTSRSLGVSSSAGFPESRVDEGGGFLYWQIGFTYIDAGGFKILNTRVGDINFELAYGALNGKPALIPVDSGPGWLDLAVLFP